MDFFEKIGDVVSTKSKQAVDKAKELGEIANLKSQISSCEDTIKKNYMEIGKLFIEEHADDENTPYEKQITAIKNAQKGIEELQKKIQEIKGL